MPIIAVEPEETTNFLSTFVSIFVNFLGGVLYRSKTLSMSVAVQISSGKDLISHRKPATNRILYGFFPFAMLTV